MKEQLESLLKTLNVEPRDYQKRIVLNTLKHFLEDKLNSVLIESPTGSGKTLCCLLIIKLLHDTYGYKACWVSMRRNLLNQVLKHRDLYKIDVPLTVISMYEKNPPTGFDLLCHDEAAHDSTASAAHIHNIIKPKLVLGCSATPFRTDRMKLCFDKIVKDAGIGALIRDGYLSPYHHYTIPNWSVRNVTDFYTREPQRWGKSLMFFHTIEQCMEAKNNLLHKGIKCEVVTGDSERETQIARLAEGKINVIVNCMILGEGFDLASLQTVFARPSCKSYTIQMCGRAFRKCETLPVKNIVQAEKTKWPFIRTALPTVQFTWKEDEWRQIEGNTENVKIANKNTYKVIVATQVELPAFLQAKKPRVVRRRGIGDRRTNRG